MLQVSAQRAQGWVGLLRACRAIAGVMPDRACRTLVLLPHRGRRRIGKTSLLRRLAREEAIGS